MTQIEQAKIKDEKIQYSKVLSSLFCSASIIILSILSLLNSQSMDLYSLFALVKVVIPASFCFWFLGYTIGKILDGYTKEIIREKIIQDKKAYEIPSIFSGDMSADTNDDGLDIL